MLAQRWNVAVFLVGLPPSFPHRIIHLIAAVRRSYNSTWHRPAAGKERPKKIEAGEQR